MVTVIESDEPVIVPVSPATGVDPTPTLRSVYLRTHFPGLTGRLHLRRAVAGGELVQVPAGPLTRDTLDAFAGTHLVLTGAVVREADTEAGRIVYIGEDESASRATAVSWLLAEVLQQQYDGDDFPTLVRRMSRCHDGDHTVEELLRMSLTGIDELLAHWLARLEHAT